MKKTLKLIAILFIMSSCSNKKTVNESQKPKLTFTYQEIKVTQKTDLYKLEDKLTVALSNEYDNTLPFVKIADILAYLKQEIDSNKALKRKITLKETKDKSVISFIHIDEDTKEEYEYKITFNLKDNTIKLSDIGLTDALVQSRSYDEANFTGFTSEVHEDNESTSHTIKLDKYNMYLYQEDEQMIIPLYLANFLFTGYDLELSSVPSKDKLEVIAYSSSDLMGLDAPTLYEKVSLTKDQTNLIIDASANYLDFILDNFYGLKEYQDVKNYDKLINKIKDSSSTKKYLVNLNKGLLSLNDLHTSISNQGFLDPDYDASLLYVSNKDYLSFINSYSVAQCDIAKIQEGLNMQVVPNDDNVLYLEIFSFDGEIKDKIEKAIKDNPNASKVIVDIRCNTGGYVNDINHILKYMSNDAWNMYASDAYGGQYYISTSSDSKVAIDKPFYLVTSGVTFSAANYLASVVNDNDLATIIGSQSNGGTCSVGLSTLPSGSVIAYSAANMCLNNKKYQFVEDGISVDQKIDFNKADDIYETIIKESNNE